MVDIHGPWELMLLGFCFVVGVSMWIGYLLGRVRTLDPYGERMVRAQPSPEGAMVFGALLVLLGGFLLSPMLANGFNLPRDGAGTFAVLGGGCFLGLGIYYFARGLHLRAG